MATRATELGVVLGDRQVLVERRVSLRQGIHEGVPFLEVTSPVGCDPEVEDNQAEQGFCSYGGGQLWEGQLFPGACLRIPHIYTSDQEGREVKVAVLIRHQGHQGSGISHETVSMQ